MYAADAELAEALAKDAPESETGKKAADSRQGMESDSADKYETEAKKLEKEGDDLKQEGQVAHDSSNFFDLGELGIELCLVLCSVAMLARNQVILDRRHRDRRASASARRCAAFSRSRSWSAPAHRRRSGVRRRPVRLHAAGGDPALAFRRLRASMNDLTHRPTKTPHRTAIVAVLMPAVVATLLAREQHIKEAAGRDQAAEQSRPPPPRAWRACDRLASRQGPQDDKNQAEAGGDQGGETSRLRHAEVAVDAKDGKQQSENDRCASHGTALFSGRIVLVSLPNCRAAGRCGHTGRASP